MSLKRFFERQKLQTVIPQRVNFCETVFSYFLEIVLIIDQIETERFFLRCLSPDENLDRYLGWMQNVDSFPFIESTNSDYSEDDLKKYIKNINNSSNSIQFSIFEKYTGLHIGNIKYHDIDLKLRSTFVGFLIGDENWQNRGVSLEVFESSSKVLFQSFKINLFKLGVNPKHFQAIKSYSKIGFIHSVPYQRNLLPDNYLLMAKFIDLTNS